MEEPADDQIYAITVPEFYRDGERIMYNVTITRPHDGTNWVLTKRFSQVMRSRSGGLFPVAASLTRDAAI
jgi:hypothetical protein